MFETAVRYICYCLYLIVYIYCTNSALICFEKKIFSIFSFQSSFTDIAKVLSEFFRDLDIVPSDVIVGLVLLRKRQQLLRLRTIHQVSFDNDKQFRIFSKSWKNISRKNMEMSTFFWQLLHIIMQILWYTHTM